MQRTNVPTALGLPAVDPLARRGILHSIVTTLGGSAAGRWAGIHLIAPADPWLRKGTRGRLCLGMTLPTANLTTSGARSGLPRTASVAYFTDRDDIILIASSFGRDRHPAWYHNLLSNPAAVLEHRGRAARYVASEVLDEAEHDRLYALAERVTAVFTGYRRRTAAVGRRIPVMRLALIGSVDSPQHEPEETNMARASNAQIAGKHVAITGGARGIGRAIAQDAAARGATISIGDLDSGLAAETAAALPTAASFSLDVCDRASFQRFLDDAEERFGPIDILVNNAGVMLIGPFLGSDPDRWRRMLDINVGGVITGMQLMLPRMLERGHGHVVNMASTAGKVAARGSAVYCGSKSAVIAITESVQAELRDSDVALSMVLPGPVKTELATGIGTAVGVKEIGP
ncbi:MAG: SDR family NAD(P)-dependent oxidoreductase, partial [Solirubrobacteraceae bacterium]